MHPRGLHGLGHRLWFGPVHASLVRAAALRYGDRVLDVGAGTGALAERLVRTGAKVICLEPDAASLAAARDLLAGNDVEFLEAPVERIPLPDSSIDAAVASVTAHHWADPAAGFAELLRVLRPGGCLVMAEFRSGGAVRHWLRRIAGSKHTNAPGLSSWQTQLTTAGFSDVTDVRAGWVSVLALFVRATRPKVPASSS